MGTPAAPPATPEATTAPSCERCKTVAHPDSMLNFGFFHDYWLCRNTGECLTRLFEARRAARAADLEARRVRTITDPGSGTSSDEEEAGTGHEAVPDSADAGEVPEPDSSEGAER